MVQKRLLIIYNKLYDYFGPQQWWPAESQFEVIIGAILTQNTNWKNVEKAISNLKAKNLLNAKLLYNLPLGRLASYIKPAGYFNIKSRRIKYFLNTLFNSYDGNLRKLFSFPTVELRRKLLEINGIGPETADSILLYAAKRPVFVVDAYTKRIFMRNRFVKQTATYEDIQAMFMRNLNKDTSLFNEYHALIVRLGKDFCLKEKPKCIICPLKCVSCKQKRW